MDTFLQSVAKDIYAKAGNDLAHTVVVFPNKRARLFFNEALVNQASHPLWAPSYLTISELFQQLSPLRLADDIQLNCELHAVYSEKTQSNESLDSFYFWGEMLLQDFDDIDKNEVPARQLFVNLSAWKKLDNKGEFLTEEQITAIQLFFHHFSPEKRTELKQRFIRLWEVIAPIYEDFRNRLQEQGIAYEGMLQRYVIEHFDASKLTNENYAFVGFNSLNKVEESLFSAIKQAKNALFYWDYDMQYLQNPQHEAATFIRKNLTKYPNALTGDYFNNLNREKKIKFIATATDNSQARYLPQWIGEHPAEKESENAIVLCDETLLQPVLHSLPPTQVKNINITMGFPLVQTPIYHFVKALLDLQISGYNAKRNCFSYDTVSPLLKHPYLFHLSPESKALDEELQKHKLFFPTLQELQKSPFLTTIFTPQTDVLSLAQYLSASIQKVAEDYYKKNEKLEGYNVLYKESFFKAFTLVNRFITLMESGEVTVLPATFYTLLLKVFSTATIPFEGEPVSGLQIMGLLETRNLDFKNIILLSVNEGKLPKGGKESSLIPYNLRRSFGMTTVEHRDSIYAYYFYRLMQRAESITLLYNSSADGMKNGEYSRFMLQYMVQSSQPIQFEFLQAAQLPSSSVVITVEKTPEVMKLLKERFNTSLNKDTVLSPSALNAYLDCRLKFFLRFIARIAPQEEMDTSINSSLFGSIFHKAAQTIFEELKASSSLIHKEVLEDLSKNNRKLYACIDKTFNTLFFKNDASKAPEYNGEQFINREVIKTFLSNLLAIDSRYAPFTYEGSEYPIIFPYSVEIDGETIPINIGGTIDRLDIKGDTLNIVDYKTGGESKPVESIESLFIPSDKRPGYALQTFLYSAAILNDSHQKYSHLKVSPNLLYINRSHNACREDAQILLEKEPVTDFHKYKEEFIQRLEELIKEIYNPQEPFTQTDFPSKCQYCDYAGLCKRTTQS